MEQELWSVETDLNKCPHCREEVNINYTSYISEKDLIENFFKRINFHLKNKCVKNKSKKINQLTIKKVLMTSTNTLYEKLNLIF